MVDSTESGLLLTVAIYSTVRNPCCNLLGNVMSHQHCVLASIDARSGHRDYSLLVVEAD